MSRLLFFFCALISFESYAQNSPSEKEMRMIDEMNYVRTNPSEYSQFIMEYVEYWEEVDSVREIAKELITILNEMKPVDSLAYSQELYDAAVKHGKWMSKNDLFEHSDFDYGENLVSGDSLARYALISLLIDDGVPDRGHRWNILDADYKYTACHQVPGTVEGIEFVFIQEFDL